MKGIVVWWPFEQGAIPHGWHECDGTLGTPDYRGRLLIGANDVYVAGTSGGSTTHDHTLDINDTNTQLQTGTVLIDSTPGGSYAYYNYPHAHTGTALVTAVMPPWAAGYWIQKL